MINPVHTGCFPPCTQLCAEVVCSLLWSTVFLSGMVPSHSPPPPSQFLLHWSSEVVFTTGSGPCSTAACMPPPPTILRQVVRLQRGESGHMTAQEAASSPSTTSTPTPPTSSLAGIRHIRSWGLFIEQACEWAVDGSVFAVQGSRATGIRRVCWHAADWESSFYLGDYWYRGVNLARPRTDLNALGLSPVLGVSRATSFCSPRPSGRSL